MKMFYDDFEVGDTIGYDENWDGRLTGRMIEHVLTEISLKDIKTWETKQNPHNMRIIKKGTNKTTQQTIDEDFDGGLTMGQIPANEETREYDLLQHIKFCLECKNEAQAIRLIEKYGFVKQETLEENVFDVEALEEQIKIANKQKDEFAIEFAVWLVERVAGEKGLVLQEGVLERFKKEKGL